MKQGAHGGNIFQAAKHLGVSPDEIFDYSSNVSPWPVELEYDVTKLLSRLPEPHSVTLKEKYAEKLGVSPENVCITSGTTEAIECICRIFAEKKVQIFSPSYSDYRHYAGMYGADIAGYYLKPDGDFRTDADVCFICNPCNPTGVTIPKPVLTDIVSNNKNTFFVIDESYMPFHQNEAEYTMLGTEPENMAVLRSFSKIYGLPGLRLGAFVSANMVFVNRLSEMTSPWSVNSLAQHAGLQLLGLDMSDTVKRLHRIKSDFLRDISELSYITPLESDVNYILCKLSGISSAELFEHCLKARVLIRDCSNFDGLDGTYIRFAMTDNMALLVKALKGVKVG